MNETARAFEKIAENFERVDERRPAPFRKYARLWLQSDYEKAAMTITGAPTAVAKAAREGIEMELVLSSARGGGNILVLSYDRDCLQLIAGTSAGQPEVPLAAIAERIAHA